MAYLYRLRRLIDHRSTAADRDLHRRPRQRLPGHRRVLGGRRSGAPRPAAAAGRGGRGLARRPHGYAAAVPRHSGERGALAHRSGKSTADVPKGLCRSHHAT